MTPDEFTLRVVKRNWAEKVGAVKMRARKTNANRRAMQRIRISSLSTANLGELAFRRAVELLNTKLRGAPDGWQYSGLATGNQATTARKMVILVAPSMGGN
jgi:hypothetical protein